VGGSTVNTTGLTGTASSQPGQLLYQSVVLRAGASELHGLHHGISWLALATTISSSSSSQPEPMPGQSLRH